MANVAFSGVDRIDFSRGEVDVYGGDCKVEESFAEKPLTELSDFLFSDVFHEGC